MDMFSSKKVKCAGCGNKITGKEPTIKALKKEYHANCFVCKKCGRPVPGEYHTHDENPWCVDCHIEFKASKCDSCGKGIGGKKIKLDDGRYFHEECLQSASQGTCGACKQSIGLVEPVIDALGKNYHKDCFRCVQCRQEITGEFTVRDDQPVCESCTSKSAGMDNEERRNSDTVVETLEETVSKVKLDDDNQDGSHGTEPSFGGRDALNETLVREAGSEYHNGNGSSHNNYPEELQSWLNVPRHRTTNLHFLDSSDDCIVCTKPVTSGVKVDVNGKTFHDECFNEATAGECSGCNKRIHITEPSVTVGTLGRDWHPQCLNCGLCGMNIDGAFNVKNDVPVCDKCYEAKLAPACAGCEQHVVGSVLKAMKQTWHPECFSCEVCREPLANGGNEFFNYEGKPYCRRDIEQANIRVI